MAQTTTVQIPVIIGDNYRHVMGSAELLEDEENAQAKLIISVTATGKDASDLVAIMTNEGEQLALSFAAIPVTPRSTKNQ